MTPSCLFRYAYSREMQLPRCKSPLHHDSLGQRSPVSDFALAVSVTADFCCATQSSIT